MGRTPSVATTSAAVRSSTQNGRPARPWKRRGVEKSKSRLSHPAWKSRKVRGIPTFPPPRRLREINQTRHFTCYRKRTSSLAKNIALFGRVTRLVLSGNGPGLQDDLLFIPGSDGLEEGSQGRVILYVQHQEVHLQLARQMQRILAVFNFQAVRDHVLLLLLPRWYASYLPTCGKFNGYVIPLLVGVFKIDGMNAVGMLEGVFFPRGEDASGNQHALPGIRRPPRTFHIKPRNHTAV